MYTAPEGGIILCKRGSGFISCAGIRKIDNDRAALKKRYVQSTYQYQGIGKALPERSIKLAKVCNYSYIRLNTLNNMLPAINLYKKYALIEIESYYHNPNPTAVFFEKQLSSLAFIVFLYQSPKTV